MIDLNDYMLEQKEIDEEIFAECPVCGSSIFVGDDYYNIDGESICTDCILEHLKQYKEVAV